MQRSACLAAVLGLALAGPTAWADADDIVSDADDYAEFVEEFCEADRTGEHIFVLPTSVFTGHGEVSCDHGTSVLRSSEPADDTGHMLLNIDPPHGVADGLDCDGKADLGMTIVAINCLPANAEGKGHRKT